MKKVLILSNKVPYPTKDGSSIAMARLLEALLEIEGLDIVYGAINTRKHWKHIDGFPKSIKERIELVTFDEDTSPTLHGGLGNLLFTNKPYNVTRFYVHSMKEWLHSFEKNTFDVIIIEGAFMGYFLPVAKVISKHVILRSHNLEHMIWERTQAKQRNLLKRLYFRIQSNRLRKFEERLARMCDSIWSISPVDSFWFKEFNSNCYFIPVAVEEGESVDTLNPNMCFHLGAMDWTPNRMAVDWFLEKIWPKVRKLNPQAQFHLAGNGMPKHYMTNPEKGIFVHGRVPSAEVFAKQHGISIIPLLSGSGVRIKLLENARWGIPIISTRIGAEGVYTTGTKEIVLADFPQDFARKLVELMDDPEAALDMGQLARKDILERFGKRSTINKITKAWPA